MGSSTYDDASQKQLEDELIDAGNRLLTHSSSTDELLSLLEKAEKLLTKVCQQPPRSTGDALLPVMKALVTDDLLRHIDVNVQVAVASCINELTRITAPNPPYSDDEMKEAFQLFMIAFKQLPCESGPNYSRAKQILETIAKVRSCLILLDIDCDLVVEMFQLFFATIRCIQPSNILKYMEMIMTLLIEESDVISLELLRPLLTSVRKDNENISPVSLVLGETVFKNCRTKLQPCLREAVEILNLDVDDYAEIVSSLCEDSYNGNNTVAKEAASAGEITESKLDGLSKTEPEDSAPLIKDNSGSDQFCNNNARSDNKEVDAAEMDNRAVPKRGRNPKSFVKPKEGREGKDSCEVSCNGESEDDSALPSKPGKGSKPNYSSHKEYDSANEGSLRRRGRSKKKENINTQGSNLESSSTPKTGTLQTAVERGSNAPKGTDKKRISGSKMIKAKKEEDLDTEVIGKVTINSQKHESVDISEKMVESPVSGAARAKHPRNLPSKTEKMSKGSPVDHGEDLVNLRIQVWWPMDKAFYPGTIVAFDPVSKKHKINYDDGEGEVLNLRKERWEILNDKKLGQAHLPHQQEADHVSQAKGPAKNEQKVLKRKLLSSSKQNATPSSKSESVEGAKLVDNSALDVVCQKDEPTNENSETNASPRHTVMNLSRNEKKVLRRKVLSSSKQNATPSSKRSKSEIDEGAKLVDNSALDVVCQKDEPTNENSETNASPRHIVMNLSRNEKKVLKRKVLSSSKQNATPSSKRSKSQSDEGAKLVDNSALDVVCQNDEPTNENSETNASPRHIVMNLSRNEKKVLKWKVFSSSKQNATPSSKRSRSESDEGAKLVDNSALDVVCQKDEPTNENSETNASPRHDEVILAGEEESETAIDKVEPGLDASKM